MMKEGKEKTIKMERRKLKEGETEKTKEKRKEEN